MKRFSLNYPRNIVVLIGLLLPLVVSGAYSLFPAVGSMANQQTTDPVPPNQAQTGVTTGASPSYDLTWWTIDGGGSTSVGGNGYTLCSTIAQPDAGLLAGGHYSLNGGFWYAIDKAEPEEITVYLPVIVR